MISLSFRLSQAKQGVVTGLRSAVLHCVCGTMIQLKVRKPEGSDFKLVYLCQSHEELKKMTVADMKETISQQLGIGPISGFQVIFRTDKLEDQHYVTKYDIKHMSTIHTVLYVPGGF